MFIFYDTETSSRDLLGQILTYAFWVVDDTYTVLEKCEGKIRLNRTQLPEVEAILVNRIQLDELQATGDHEYGAAHKLFEFLNRVVETAQTATLVGFNSNQFDLQFLRNLLIRYGYNPYFFGRLKNLDVLHFCRWVALENPDTFLWQEEVSERGEPYFSFKLEKLATAYGVLTGEQAHDASADVLVTIDLVKVLESRYNVSLKTFKPIDIQFPDGELPFSSIAKQKTVVGPIFWAPFLTRKKEQVLLNLCAYANRELESSLMACLKYVNVNKHFLILERPTPAEEMLWEQVLETASQDPELCAISSMDLYFEKIKKSWDIEYQIHEMGFDRISILGQAVSRLIASPQSYEGELARMLSHWKAFGKSPKDTALLQLYNRAYLNWHPSPKPEDFRKYLVPRYVTGDLLRNPEDCVPFDVRFQQLRTQVERMPEDEILQGLWRYYQAFQSLF